MRKKRKKSKDTDGIRVVKVAKKPKPKKRKRYDASDKDPKTGHFLPGNKGGPGRTKGSISLRTELRLLLSEIVRICKGDKRQAKTKARLLVESLYSTGRLGDTKAIQIAMEHVDGKPVQAVVDLTPENRLAGVSDEKLDRIINGGRHKKPKSKKRPKVNEPAEEDEE